MLEQRRPGEYVVYDDLARRLKQTNLNRTKSQREKVVSECFIVNIQLFRETPSEKKHTSAGDKTER